MSSKTLFQNYLTPIDEFDQSYKLSQSNYIAEGRLGRVYSYIKKKTGEVFAVQIMQNLDRQTRFNVMEEIRTVNSIQKDANYLVKIVDLVQQIHTRKGGQLETYSLHLIMEIGFSLQHIMKQQSEMSMKDILYHFKNIIKIIVKLHSNKLYHGNLKPQNILYIEETNSNGGKVKKLKFSGFFNTKKGQKIYTPYTPNDLVNQWKNYDKINGNYLLLGDIYSVGMIIICLCLNKHKVLEDHLDPEQLLDNLKVKVEQKLYSNDLFLLLKDMVEEDPEKRPSYKDVQERIKIIEQKENFPEEEEELKNVQDESNYKLFQSKQKNEETLFLKIFIRGKKTENSKGDLSKKFKMNLLIIINKYQKKAARKYTVDKCNNVGTHGQNRLECFQCWNLYEQGRLKVEQLVEEMGYLNV
ncbi:hypothetical protein ABPG72_003122 [Tetrahymena utriculariae]